MEQFDFSELEKIIPAILHTVGLIWANSKYYCRAPRMIVLLQELCNMLIEMVSSQSTSHLRVTAVYSSQEERGFFNAQP